MKFIQIFLSAERIFCAVFLGVKSDICSLMSRSNPSCVYPSEEDYNSLPRVSPLPTTPQNDTQPCSALTHAHLNFLLISVSYQFNINFISQNSRFGLKTPWLLINHLSSVFIIVLEFQLHLYEPALDLCEGHTKYTSNENILFTQQAIAKRG